MSDARLRCMDIAKAAGLQAGRRVGREQRYRCPRHKDTNPSLTINVEKNVWMCGPCGAKGTAWQLAAFIADKDPADKVAVSAWLTQHNVLNGHESRASATKRSTRSDRVVATYDYRDAKGDLRYQSVRYELATGEKAFKCRRPNGKGGWVPNLDGVARVPYALERLVDRTPEVWITEGEKDAERLWSLGLPATTNILGAGKWCDEYSTMLEQLAGVQRVYVLRDHDVPGHQHGDQVAASLTTAGVECRLIVLPGLHDQLPIPEKHGRDVSDWLDYGHTRDELVALSANTPPWSAGGPTDSQATTMETGPVVVCLADVEPESITWLWPGRVAAGKLTLIVGDPGLGKSWITLDIAARLSSGRMWPDQVPGGAPADVLLLSAEDGIADTIRPRLDALAADVIRVHHLAVLRVGQKEHAIQLTNIAALEQAISQTKAQLVIIDPVSAYLGSTDSHRDAEVRGLMAPLAHLADRTGVAVLGVMHLAKSSQQPAIYRPIGSIAFTAAARLVLAVAADPEQDHRRILAPLKQNICAAAPALAYTLAEGRLEWEADPVSDVDVDVLLSAPTQDRQERLEAGAWLRQALADGPVESTQLQTEAAETAGISTRTLFRAKERLKVDAFKQGYGKDGKWYWRLPSPKVAT